MSRRILLVLLAILFVWGIAFAATPGDRTSPGRGEIIQMPYPSDPPKKFRLVRYIGLTDLDGLPVDSIVVWDTIVDDGVTIITTTTSGDSTVAGILATAILTQDTVDNTAVQDIGKDNWAWLQTYGIAQVDVSSEAAIVVGDAMGTGSTAEQATAYVSGSNNSLKQGYAGFFFDAAAASATNVQCFLRVE